MVKLINEKIFYGKKTMQKLIMAQININEIIMA